MLLESHREGGRQIETHKNIIVDERWVKFDREERKPSFFFKEGIGKSQARQLKEQKDPTKREEKRRKEAVHELY